MNSKVETQCFLTSTQFFVAHHPNAVVSAKKVLYVRAGRPPNRHLRFEIEAQSPFDYPITLSGAWLEVRTLTFLELGCGPILNFESAAPPNTLVVPAKGKFRAAIYVPLTGSALAEIEKVRAGRELEVEFQGHLHYARVYLYRYYPKYFDVGEA